MENNIVTILQARVSSTRLPGKVLRPILGTPMLLRQIERVRQAKNFNQLVVATSLDKIDDPIEKICTENSLDCFRGQLVDVLDRHYRAALLFKADHIVRLTGDCPLVDPQIIDEVITLHLENGYDYTSNCYEPTFPDGLDVEIFTFSCLKAAWEHASLPSEREHVTQYIINHPEHFNIGSMKGNVDLSDMRWTVDTLPDFEFVSAVYDKLYPGNRTFSTRDILSLLSKNPAIGEINSQFKRNEGLAKSLQEDFLYNRQER